MKLSPLSNEEQLPWTMVSPRQFPGIFFHSIQALLSALLETCFSGFITSLSLENLAAIKALFRYFFGISFATWQQRLITVKEILSSDFFLNSFFQKPICFLLRKAVLNLKSEPRLKLRGKVLSLLRWNRSLKL